MRSRKGPLEEAQLMAKIVGLALVVLTMTGCVAYVDPVSPGAYIGGPSVVVAPPPVVIGPRPWGWRYGGWYHRGGHGHHHGRVHYHR